MSLELLRQELSRYYHLGDIQFSWNIYLGYDLTIEIKKNIMQAIYVSEQHIILLGMFEMKLNQFAYTDSDYGVISFQLIRIDYK